jgi:hypothetical protein
MTEGAEACLVVDLKLSPIQVFKGTVKVLGEITDSLGMAEVDQEEVIPNFLLLSPTISRLTQMPMPSNNGMLSSGNSKLLL